MAQPELKKANRKLTWQLWLFAAGSLAFGFALVPLYNVLCEVTGYGDRSKLVEAASIVEAPDDKRTVTIELISTAPTFGSTPESTRAWLTKLNLDVFESWTGAS